MRLVFLTLSLLCAIQLRAADAAPAPRLSAEDRRLLESLLHEFLFDPLGAQRIVIPTQDETGHRKYDAWSHEAWLVPGSRQRPARAFSTDGSPAWFDPGHYKRVNFPAACQARYAPRAMNSKAPSYGKEDLAIAAWLYRLHEPALAARALAAARQKGDDPRAALRRSLAHDAYGQLIVGFTDRADEAALAAGRHLLRLYGDEAKQHDFDLVEPIMADLERRQRKGTFGKTPSKQWPTGFDQWDAARQCAYLIDSLEDIHREQDGYPGGVDFAADRRVAALIRLGDAAVPPLLDALEHDERLTRSTHSWRMGMGTVVLGVREPVLTALMSILQVQAFEIGATGDSFTGRGEEGRAPIARRLREYWNRFGAFPFDERMMKVLADPATSFEAKREAAVNLGALGEKTTRGTMFGVGSHVVQPALQPNPAVAKFNNPTAAEAILAAMDADLRAFDASPEAKEQRASDARANIASRYLWALADLGDGRVAPAIVERFTPAPLPSARAEVALVAHRLSLEEPLRALAEELRRGPAAPSDDQVYEWLTVMRQLSEVETPEVQAGLQSVLQAEHSLHAGALRQALRSDSEFPRPYRLKLLRAALDETTLTGAVDRLENGQHTRDLGHGGSYSGPAPDFLKGSAHESRTVPLRVCDEGAEALCGSDIHGLPFYHPLLPDAPERLERLRSVFDHYRQNYYGELGPGPNTRSVYPGSYSSDPVFPLLGRSATEEDVAAGRAIFHLHGQGRPAPLVLPAFAHVQTGNHQRPTRSVTIVQAEIDGRRRAVFGIIDEHEIRTASASELTDIEPYTAILQREAEWEAERERDEP